MEKDLFVTGKSGKKINVEMVGMDSAQDMRSDLINSREISL